MSIFPVSRIKTKVQSFRRGGTPTNEAAGGLDIRYIPTAADIPNLAAIESYSRAMTDLNTKRAEEIEKQRPDLNSSLEYINKQNMTSGQKTAFSKRVQENYDAIDTLMRSGDPDAIFKASGRDLIKKYGADLLSPERLSKAGDTKRSLDANYEAGFKNGTLQELDISKGKILVEDKEGNKQRVTISELEKAPGKYKRLSKQEAYEYNESSESFDTDHLINGAQFNYNQALAEVGGYFANANGSFSQSGAFSESRSNISALNAARRQAKENLSQNSRDAMMAEYVKRNENFTEAGFNKFIDDEIDNEFNKHKQVATANKIDANDLMKLMAKKNGAGSDGYLNQNGSFPNQHTVDVKIDLSAAGRLFSGKNEEQKQIPVLSESAKYIDKDKIHFKSFDGKNTYFYGDTGGGDQATSSAWNEDENNPVTINGSKYVQHTGAQLMPVLNGMLYEKTKDPKTWKSTTVPADLQGGVGKLVSFRDDNDAIFAPNSKILPNENGEGYYIVGRDGKRYGVEMRAFNQYSVLDKDGNQYSGTDQVIYEQQDLQQSVEFFDNDYSGTNYNSPYISGTKLTGIGVEFMNKVKSANPEAYQLVNQQLLNLPNVNPQQALIESGRINMLINQLERQLNISLAKSRIPKIPVETSKVSGNQAIQE